MSQAWMQVLGLALDFAGFALIAWEWMLAQRAERAILLLEATAARTADGRSQLARGSANPGLQRHLETVGEMERRRTEIGVQQSRENFARRRHGAIYAGMVLVLLGFVCQLLGAWPGCCRAIGILPSG